MELLHVTGGGNVPAEVLLHISTLQGLEAFPVVVIQIQAAADSAVEVVCIVALEVEAQT